MSKIDHIHPTMFVNAIRGVQPQDGGAIFGDYPDMRTDWETQPGFHRLTPKGVEIIQTIEAIIQLQYKLGELAWEALGTWPKDDPERLKEFLSKCMEAAE